MKLALLLDELESTNQFKEFMAKYPAAYLAAGFFVINSEKKCQLDYFIPSLKKMAIIEWPFEKEFKIQDDLIENSEKLGEIKIDISDLFGKVEEEKKKRKIAIKTNKIIAILKENKWNLTCLSPVLDIFKIEIDAVTGEVLKFEKASMMDFMQIKSKK